MRFSLGLLLLSIVSSALCTDLASDRFNKYQRLSPSAPVELEDSSYDDLTSTPRDYHVTVLLTATDARYGCILCRDFQPEWELIARSWSRGSGPETPKMLFGTLDFNNGKSTFQKV